ncbi:hypothetical protein [Pseudovibrio ascidiaceicola]|uniref:hypothetical protein n=1 Tax=Pseudovibrio ascidiaceicola TaxID=285279 RepID=UPI001AD90F2E|nr:hypothetical protein [Pseudovibrio ascidiaceicola]
MLRKLVKLFSKRQETRMFIVHLNVRVQPLDRGEIFEDVLDAEIRKLHLGEVTGGGTALTADGEIESCDIEIDLNRYDDDAMKALQSILKQLPVPKGSKIIDGNTDEEIPIGELEGLALYLNGSDLDSEVYETCDANHVYTELYRLTEGTGVVLSHWQGKSETGLYLYGKSFKKMNDQIASFIETYPLCQKCRVEKIA